LKTHFSFSEIQSNLRTGTISCVDRVLFHLSNIRKKSHLNAFLSVYEDEALARAAEIDKKIKRGIAGKLAGMVVGLKDVLAYKDHPLQAGSKILENFVSQFTATAVQRLLDEDAIIIGRQNCDEFAMGSTNENSAYGKVLNALDETRIPGGSSGGSAVAVQAGLCMVSLGSDTGGSVRQPADLCGIVGLKPTYGRISRYGLIAYASSFDQIGIFSINIPDTALLLEVMAGLDDFDSTVSERRVEQYTSSLTENKKYRIAYFNEALNHPSLDPEISKAMQGTLDDLRQKGHEVQPVEFDLLEKLLRAAGRILTREELSKEVLGRSPSPFDRSIDMHISNLRKYLVNQSAATERIKTVRGVGYIYAQASASGGK